MENFPREEVKVIFLETFSLFPNENFPQQKEEVEAEVQTNFSNDIPVVN